MTRRRYNNVPIQGTPSKRWQHMQNAHFDENDPNTKILTSVEGWVGVFMNDIYQVSVTENNDMYHLTIRRRDSEAIHDWRHFQLIKNDICGPEREGVEIYPAESRLVDSANQWHVWVLPAGERVPWGYQHRDVSDRLFGKNKNRPFDDPPPDLNAVVVDDIAAFVPVSVAGRRTLGR